jgi:hypothetical protein
VTSDVPSLSQVHVYGSTYKNLTAPTTESVDKSQQLISHSELYCTRSRRTTIEHVSIRRYVITITLNTLGVHCTWYKKVMISLCSIPSDCHASIVAFLPLEGVIGLGSASLTCLSDVQPEISRRRKRFTQQFCYSSEREYSSETHFRIPKAQLNLHPHSYLNTPPDGLAEKIRLLPTVSDRINSLYRVLPTTHPSYSNVVQLRSAISITNGTDNDCGGDIDRDGDGDVPSIDELRKRRRGIDYESLLRAHVHNVRPHKLHALILRHAIRSDPLVVDRGHTYDSHGALTVTLARYIGDVHCAYYLLGHSDSGIIEASPTDNEWKANLMSELNNSRNIETFYRAWVFLHSTLLRVAPFSAQQQACLGIAPPTPPRAEIATDSAGGQGSLSSPLAPFRANVTDAFWQQHSIEEWISRFPPLRVTFRHFGPLGPAFRGRDMMELLLLQPVALANVVSTFAETDPREYTGGSSSPTLSPMLRHWANEEHNVIQFMVRMHDQSRRIRPVTVVPPQVSLRPVLR